MNNYTLAFDLGRVIFDFDLDIALDKMKENLAVSKEEIVADIFTRDFAADFERGLVSGNEFYSKFRDRYKLKLRYEDFVPIWNEIFTPKPEMINLVKVLRDHYPTYLISNINKLHFEFLHQHYAQVFSLFRALILSYRLRAIKPERAIYQELREVSGREFKDIIYIDDRSDLIDAARPLGLNCIQFHNIDQLCVELSRLGVAVDNLSLQ